MMTNISFPQDAGVGRAGLPKPQPCEKRRQEGDENEIPKSPDFIASGSEPVWCALSSNLTSTSTSSITTSTPGHIDAPPAPTTIGGGNLTFSNAIVGYTTLGGPLSAGPTTGVIWSANSLNTDLPQAQRCWSSIANWRPGSVAWYNAQIANSTWPLTVATSTSVILWETSTTIYPANASTFTLCDHTPRVDVEPITQHSSWNTTLSFTTTRLATPTYSVPKPCRPNNHICRILYYESNIYNVSGTEDEWEHECGFPAHADPVGKPCLIAGGPVQLVYFPVETRGGNLCAHNGTTIAPTTTGDPPTITAMGTTFTSGSVYLSFWTLFAYYDGFGYNDTVDPTFTNHVVALPSSAISTHCGGWFSAMGPGTSMNYADLNWPVAASAYSCQGRCVIPAQTTSCDLAGCYVTGLPKDPHCDTIWGDVNPVLALPTEVSKMVPEWSACSAFDEALPNFWFDPPLALQPTDAVATSSLPADGTMSTPASPSSTAVRPAPQTIFPPPVPAALPTAQSEVLPSSGPQAPDNGEPDTSTSPQTWAYTTPPPVAGLTSTAGGSIAQVPGPGDSDPGRLPSASASEVSSRNRLSSSSNNGDSDPSLAAQVSQTSSWNIADVLASILHLSK
nr:hypothetical protein B0A51_07670 [Rachicladosporium sp. CCFEE 5018]